MLVEIENWTIDKTIKVKDTVDPKPQYQRGNVWADKDNSLLIDSILKGFDIPKIYLRKTSDNPMYQYEVADGQQRLYAIWEFAEGNVTIKELELDNKLYTNVDFNKLKSDSELTEVYKKFKKFQLTISILAEATDNEVRTLFARLQMGKRLNEPEKRNAVGSAIGFAIDAEVKTCPFFTASKISDSRFTKQDYLAHAITLIHFDNTADLKADQIKKMYEQLYVAYPLKYMKNAHKVLNWMHQINKEMNLNIKNKWAFVDFFWMLYRRADEISGVDAENMAAAFGVFETKRLQYSKHPEELIDTKDKTLYDKHMYDYIYAFNLSGSSKDNINIRATVFDRKFSKFLKVK